MKLCYKQHSTEIKAQPSNICTWTCLISIWTFLMNVSPCYHCKVFYSKAPVVLAFNHCCSSSLLPYLLFSLHSMHISPCCLCKKEPFKNLLLATPVYKTCAPQQHYCLSSGFGSLNAQNSSSSFGFSFLWCCTKKAWLQTQDFLIYWKKKRSSNTAITRHWLLIYVECCHTRFSAARADGETTFSSVT